MLLQFFKSKIHRATVTQANLQYVGSITIDEVLMEAANLYEGEKVQIVNNNNGERFETYVIKGEKNSGMVCLNGAAARKAEIGFHDEILRRFTLRGNIANFGYVGRNFEDQLSLRETKSGRFFKSKLRGVVFKNLKFKT